MKRRMGDAPRGKGDYFPRFSLVSMERTTTSICRSRWEKTLRTPLNSLHPGFRLLFLRKSFQAGIMADSDTLENFN